VRLCDSLYPRGRLPSPGKVAALLFGSGFCALVYQTAWLRQFRLIFGGSTAATAAVLAIFMFGLGAGSAILGKRADAHPRPLAFYGNLELMIAASAALSPAILWLIARVYFATGGSVTLGLAGASIVRLLLSTFVLGLPTFLMGGTLPAAARAVQTDADGARHSVALLYGANTLGAVAGTLVSTFYMLEAYGNRRTLFIAVLINVIVAIVARSMGRSGNAVATDDAQPLAATSEGMSRNAVLAAAAIVGFAFLLMELVWYRMLAPLLGGTTFTFGLILATALLGIGLGGAAYSLWGGSRRATPGGFALTCSLEAAAMALPFALGDRLAIQQHFLRPLGAIGFSGYVMAWTILTVVAVLPAALIAGVQFPLLISLLGRGRDDVGREVGLAYAWNTAGAIAGSLAGGFGLLPLLTAPGSWRLVIILLAVVGIAATFFAARQRQIASAAIAALTGIAAIAATFALGPTAVWRHAGIGAGRSTINDKPNAIREFIYGSRRTIVWDADGRESSVALADGADLAFLVNGKTDGSARGDAGTQVMSGMIGAALHPNPQRALVIGLGTGSTAGWLGAVPTMQRVDVVELEPAILRVAAACSAVNHDVLRNPKVKIRIADAREVLLATRDRYDIIFSEPSNPYRAGIASLFTQEFYRAVSGRLGSQGIFLQWVQAYEVDSRTIRTIYGTLSSVFPYVETWHTDSGDLLLVATKQPIVKDAAALRRRVSQRPYIDAMSGAWRVQSLEGFLAHFVARDTLSRAIAQSGAELNTDDRTPIEFGFARGLGSSGRFEMNDLTELARARREDRPIVSGFVNWDVFDANRASVSYLNALPSSPSADLVFRHRMTELWDKGDLAGALGQWHAHPFRPVNTQEVAMIGECLAESRSEAALAYAALLRPWQPIDADVIEARVRYREGRLAEATALLHRVFVAYRSDPWPTVDLMGRSLDMALDISKTRQFAPAIYDGFSQPFAAGQWNDARRYYLAIVARTIWGCGPQTVAALRAVEPWPAWKPPTLSARRDCYASAMLHPLADIAQRDWNDYQAALPVPLARGVK